MYAKKTQPKAHRTLRVHRHKHGTLHNTNQEPTAIGPRCQRLGTLLGRDPSCNRYRRWRLRPTLKTLLDDTTSILNSRCGTVLESLELVRVSMSLSPHAFDLLASHTWCTVSQSLKPSRRELDDLCSSQPAPTETSQPAEQALEGDESSTEGGCSGAAALHCAIIRRSPSWPSS